MRLFTGMHLRYEQVDLIGETIKELKNSKDDLILQTVDPKKVSKKDTKWPKTGPI